MDINIREYITKNFKESDASDIKASIEESMEKKDEITLPGLGFFFEIVWEKSDDETKDKILNILSSYFK